MKAHATAILASAAFTCLSAPAMAVPFDFTAVALTDQTAPGAGGALYSGFDFGRPALTAGGEVGFSAQLGAAGSGAFRTTGGAPELIVRTGDPVPGFPGVAFESVTLSALNAGGAAAIFATTSNPQPADRFTLHVGPPGGLGLVAFGNAFSTEETFGLTFLSEPALSDDVRAFFTARLSGTMSVFGILGGEVLLVGSVGDVPGGAGGLGFATLGAPAANGGGDVALVAELTGPMRYPASSKRLGTLSPSRETRRRAAGRSRGRARPTSTNSAGSPSPRRSIRAASGRSAFSGSVRARSTLSCGRETRLRAAAARSPNSTTPR